MIYVMKTMAGEIKDICEEDIRAFPEMISEMELICKKLEVSDLYWKLKKDDLYVQVGGSSMCLPIEIEHVKDETKLYEDIDERKEIDFEVIKSWIERELGYELSELAEEELYSAVGTSYNSLILEK